MTPRTVPAVLREAASRFADREAVVDGDVRLTYRELHQRVRELARLFVARGVEPGDRVAINSPNTWHWVVAALAALHCGAAVVPVNTRFTATETSDVLRRSRARALVVAGRFLDRDRLAELRAFDELAALRCVVRVPVEDDRGDPDAVAWGEFDCDAPWSAVDERADAVRPDDISDVLYTSGTTGRSKGALTAHRQSLGVAAAWADCGLLTEQDRYLVVNPFFHSFGYKAGILACLLRGAAVLPMAVFDVGRVLELVERERISVLPGPPTIYQSIMDNPRAAGFDLSSLRLAVTGAATVPVALVERMRHELSFSTVLTAYGLTEAVVATMCRADDDPVTVATTCGRPASGFELRIDGSGGEPGATGEILLRGPNAMLGYDDDPAATAAAIDADGWLHTGDVGHVDERGYLTITDRLKDMYICGGFNVYPAEVEQALARLDGVADSAVVGVADGRLGEVGKAFVVLRPGSALSEDDVIAHCRERLANYKVPRHVEFREDLPRNPSGKILKRQLR